METTRHFTTTTYVVNDGECLLHDHERLGMLLPPGGHLDRDELPREAAVRETREETGLEVELLESKTSVGVAFGRELPPAEHVMLYDVDQFDGEVAHQHINFVYYGMATSRDLSPADDERAVDCWRWFSPDDLRTHDGVTEEVSTLGLEAIERVENR